MAQHGAWERQPSEPPAAHRAFERYRTMGPERTVKAAAELAGLSYNTMRTYSSENDWAERVRAWDAHVAAKKDEATISEAQRLAREQLQVWSDVLTVAGREARRLVERDGDAEPPDYRELVLMAKEATQAQRLIIGEATERTEQAGQIDLDALSPEARAGLRLVMDELGVDEI